MDSGIITRSLRIRGLVQGVGFRWSLCREAQHLGLAGWVRNRHDGSVEALVRGTPTAVENITAWAQHGPPAARVSDVHCADGDEQVALSGFTQAPTA